VAAVAIQHSRLRILVLSNLCPPDFDGGFEMRAFQIAGALRERGHEVQFVTSDYRPTFHGTKGDPVWVHRILKYVEKGESGAERIRRFVAAFPESVRNAKRVDAFLQTREFDIAYLFGLHRIGLASHYPLVQRGVPILWHAGDPFLVRQLKVWPRQVPPYNWLLNSLYRESRRMELEGDYRNIAFVSERLREYYMQEGLTPDRSFIIPRGVDFPLGRDVDRLRLTPPVFFQACRLHEQKGPHISIAAAALLAKEAPNLAWRLEIAGAPEHPKYREHLLSLIKEHKLGSRVSLIGQLPRSEVLLRMRSATALIHASIFEDPFANTIVETLGAGTPLIGSDIGSIREVVEPEASALLFKPGDAAELAKQMKRTLLEPGLRSKLAKAGIQIVEQRYTMDRILDLTLGAFDDILVGRGRESLCASA